MSRNSQNSEDSVEYAISVETRVVAYNYKEGKIGPAACDHLHTGRTHPHAAHSISVVGKTRSTTMKYPSMLEALIDDWPNVPVGITWGLVAIPIATLVACCLWLRIFWPGSVRHNGEISSKQLKDCCNDSER